MVLAHFEQFLFMAHLIFLCDFWVFCEMRVALFRRFGTFSSDTAKELIRLSGRMLGETVKIRNPVVYEAVEFVRQAGGIFFMCFEHEKELSFFFVSPFF